MRYSTIIILFFSTRIVWCECFGDELLSLEHTLSDLIMRNAENYILIDGETGMSSSDEPLAVANGDQNNRPDIDELHQLLGDTCTSEANDPETINSKEYDASLIVDERSVSALEELEDYGVSGETGVDDTDASLQADDSSSGEVSNASSLMAEMEELYGDSVGAEIDNAETNTETEESTDEDTSENVALTEELEELFSSSTESADTDISSQISEQFSVEEDASSISALDELRAFLDDTTQIEAGDIEISSVDTPEHSFASRRSVLDELQNLLQSCTDDLKVDELSADANSTIGNMSVFTDVEYPSREELQHLLETTLSQLVLFSDSSSAMTYTDSVSVLDELKNFMHETGAADTDEISDSLFASDGLDEAEENDEDAYDISSISEDVAVKEQAADSIIDELNLLLSDSETFDTALESDSLTSDISDESPTSDELAAYMAGLSDETEIDIDTTDAESVSASNTLEELEAMLNEIGISDNDKTSDSIKAGEDDFSYENVSGQSHTDNEEEKFEDKTALYKASNVEVVTDKSETAKAAENNPVEEVNLLDEQYSNNRVPVAGLLLTTVLAVGLYAFWSLLDSGAAIDERSEAAQHSAVQMQKSEYGSGDEYLHGWMLEENSGAGITAEADAVYQYEPLEEIETYSYEPISSYQDEPLTVETTEQNIDIKVVQAELTGDAQTTVEDIAKETISLEVNNLQQENKENIEQLQRRMADAESSIAKLQEEKTGKPDDTIEPVPPVLSEQIEKPAQADKAGFTEQTDLAAPHVHKVSEPVQPALPEHLVKPEVQQKPELPVKQEIIEPPGQMVPVIRAQGKGGNLWSVQLSSYYGKPPPASELKYLENAGISYEIKKAVVNEKVWYRVIVDEFSEYEKAKQFSDDIRKNAIRKDMWINKSQ